ncbi:MAG: phosphoadenylyl-sulfate reductase [Nannocystales bacterium]
MLNSLQTHDVLPTHLRDPLEILRWAGQGFPQGLVLASALGPQSIVALDLAVSAGLDVDVVLLDTGLLFEETLQLASRLETRLGVSIERVKPALTLDEQAEALGEELWETDPAKCCEIRKVKPLANRLDSASAWITGLRRSGSLVRAEVESVEWDSVHGLVKINPLAWWSRARVFEHLHSHKLPYNPLLDDGYASVGCRPCTSRVGAGEDERAGRWRGRGKTECGIHHRLAAAQPQEEAAR